jgi:hypothetical protein
MLQVPILTVGGSSIVFAENRHPFFGVILQAKAASRR